MCGLSSRRRRRTRARCSRRTTSRAWSTARRRLGCRTRLTAVGLQADQCAGRRHQLHQPGSRPPAARLRRRQAQGRRVVARLGKAGEKFLGLDGKEHNVDDDDVRHRRRHRPLGLGGIIGGEASGSTDATRRTFFIECGALRSAAYGRDGAARPASSPMRAIASSAASIRNRCCPGLDLATQMIHKLGGGKPYGHTVVPARCRTAQGHRVSDRRPHVDKLGGHQGAGEATFERYPSEDAWLGVPRRGRCSDSDDAVVAAGYRTAPSFSCRRGPRIAGIDHIPATPLPRPVRRGTRRC